MPPTEQIRDRFQDVFGDDPCGGPATLDLRVGSGTTGRCCRFMREQIAQRNIGVRNTKEIQWLN